MAFVRDAQTEASLNSCLSHFSLSDASIKRGGIAGAIRHLDAARVTRNDHRRRKRRRDAGFACA